MKDILEDFRISLRKDAPNPIDVLQSEDKIKLDKIGIPSIFILISDLIFLFIKEKV